MLAKEKDKSTFLLRDALPELARMEEKKNEVDDKVQNILKENEKLLDIAQNMSAEVKNKTNEMDIKITEAQTSKSEEIKEINGELKKEYEDRVKKALAGCRDVYENQLKCDKEEFKNKYEKKITTLKSLLCKQRAMNDSEIVDQDEYQRRIEGLLAKESKLTDSNLEVDRRTRELSENTEEQQQVQEKQVRNL